MEDRLALGLSELPAHETHQTHLPYLTHLQLIHQGRRMAGPAGAACCSVVHRGGSIAP